MGVRIFTAHLQSVSPYSQSKYVRQTDEREDHHERELRTWRERMHVTPDGHVFIPAMAFKNCLQEAAKFLTEKVKGKGNATYTKHFEAGTLVTEDVILPLLAKDIPCDELFVPSDGKRGGSKRVIKYFPRIDKWEAHVAYYVFDPIITYDVFERTLIGAGQFIGLGRFRPRNGGTYGRFKLVSLAEADG